MTEPSPSPLSGHYNLRYQAKPSADVANRQRQYLASVASWSGTLFCALSAPAESESE